MSSSPDGLLGDSTTVHACGWMRVWLDLAARTTRKRVGGGAHSRFGTLGQRFGNTDTLTASPPLSISDRCPSATRTAARHGDLWEVTKANSISPLRCSGACVQGGGSLTLGSRAQVSHKQTASIPRKQQLMAASTDN